MIYIALLRGVNVGGNNKIQMPKLKKCFENIGFKNVTTYINSGNVIFESEELNKMGIIAKCIDVIEAEFCVAVDLEIIGLSELEYALKNAPDWWGSDEDSKHNAIFVIEPTKPEQIINDIGEINPEYEKIYVCGRVIFWSANIKTYSRTRLSKIVGKSLYRSITIRNYNTTKKLLEIALSKENREGEIL